MLDPRPIIKRTTATTVQRTTWLKNAMSLNLAWKKRVQRSHKLPVDTLSAYPGCLKVSHRSTPITPLNLVMTCHPCLNSISQEPCHKGTTASSIAIHDRASTPSGASPPPSPAVSLTTTLSSTSSRSFSFQLYEYAFPHHRPQAQVSASMAALVSILTMFPYPLPPTNADHRAAIATTVTIDYSVLAVTAAVATSNAPGLEYFDHA